MNKQQGFTLIELTIAIIILGILAASAVPKFTNLSSDARLAVLKGMEGALRSGVNLIYAKAVLTNQDNPPEEDKDKFVADIDGITMTLHSGYPDGNWMNGVRYAISLDDVEFSKQAEDICKSNWCGRGEQQELPSGIVITQGYIAKVFPQGYSWNDQCGVYYINYHDGSKPEIGLETKECK
ncbi:prepilin-type N-terminal cleavage/methylation domain-containing protein [Moritella sp. F3]|uniref:prepilin-type N-terminal cleavage/methylation domain-containing protein n=1 Tax=Moritella sp. F3 TaxID=2718882 RepID=UPI0018E0E99E|nr:prepilin-type N-terminal cleavage/methylation domain-containing protein [Moritella sp. F3]GIC77738.1 hypothetical protein FMO001_24650 [Moritella sp. F1]GIC83121.1 hypothetical protein FMO003_34010 [Moritella sp. F3]